MTGDRRVSVELDDRDGSYVLRLVGFEVEDLVEVEDGEVAEVSLRLTRGEARAIGVAIEAVAVGEGAVGFGATLIGGEPEED